MISICRTIQHQIAVASAHPIVRTAKHTPVTDHLTHCRQFQIQKIHSRIKPVDGYCYKRQKSEKQRSPCFMCISSCFIIYPRCLGSSNPLLGNTTTGKITPKAMGLWQDLEHTSLTFLLIPSCSLIWKNCSSQS